MSYEDYERLTRSEYQIKLTEACEIVLRELKIRRANVQAAIEGFSKMVEQPVGFWVSRFLFPSLGL